MALNGNSSVTFDVKSSASTFFQAFMTSIDFPKEGNAEMEIDTIGDTEKRRRRYKMSRFQISRKWYKTLKETVTGDKAWQNPDCYKKLEATMTVIAKEDGNGADVEWTVDFEKIRSNIAEPRYIIETCLRFFKEMDENLAKSE